MTLNDKKAPRFVLFSLQNEAKPNQINTKILRVYASNKIETVAARVSIEHISAFNSIQ